MAQALAKTAFNEEVDVDALAFVLVSVIRGSALQLLLEGRPVRRAKIISTIDALFSGLLAGRAGASHKVKQSSGGTQKPIQATALSLDQQRETNP